MPPSPAFHIVAQLVLAAAIPACAWDELGPIAEARRAHPGLFRKGAVSQIEVDGVEYWAFAGDSDQRDGFTSLSDTERYAEAALDARRNLLRHVTGGAKNVTAEVSNIVVAYRFADGLARRVICLVPMEKVRVLSANSPAAAPTESPSPVAPVAPLESTAAPAPAEPPSGPPATKPPEPPAGAPAMEAPMPSDTGLPRFSPPSLPTPVIP